MHLEALAVGLSCGSDWSRGGDHQNEDSLTWRSSGKSWLMTSACKEPSLVSIHLRVYLDPVSEFLLISNVP